MTAACKLIYRPSPAVDSGPFAIRLSAREPFTLYDSLVSRSVSKLFPLLFFLPLFGCRDEDLTRSEGYDWRADWSLPQGYSLEMDADGFSMPTALAFVPAPGPQQADPLYYVAELNGRVRVVLNDRSVLTFAEGVMSRRPDAELPQIEGETGLGGLCLDPVNGYVFVTYAYRDSTGAFRNGMTRFDSEPQRFSVTPTATTSYDHLFLDDESTISHQIGGCSVTGDTVFVGVADGRQLEKSQQVQSSLGKLLRFHVDGTPLPSNPFFSVSDDHATAGLVWAYGFRNPFGVFAVGERVMVADNGSGIDRFVEVEPGGDYLWSGRDASIAARADAVIVPSVGPAQLAHIPQEHPAFDAGSRGSFLVAMSSAQRGGLLRIPYDLRNARMMAEPEVFARYDGAEARIVSAVAVGPDGVYFAAILPDPEGRTPVYRVRYDPERAHPHQLADRRDPMVILTEANCLGCHKLDGNGGSVAPPLDRDELVERIEERLASAEYRQRLAQLDLVASDSHYVAARRDVLAASELAQVQLWIRNKLLMPRFDLPNSQMPDLELSESEAVLLARHLTRQQDRVGLVALIKSGRPSNPGRRDLVTFAGAGFLAGVVLVLLLQHGDQRRQRTRRDKH